MSHRPPLIQAALELIDEAFEKKAWHGPNLRGTIRGLGAAEAAWRPAPGRHSVWELVVHAAYWKYAVRRRLGGEKRGSFALPGSNWFPRPDAGDDKAWAADVRLQGRDLRQLAMGAISLKRGGVGMYSRRSNFIHVDSGPIRKWNI